jgi:hypothetical protein
MRDTALVLRDNVVHARMGQRPDFEDIRHTGVSQRGDPYERVTFTNDIVSTGPFDGDQ